MSRKLGSARVHLTSLLKAMKDSANLSDRECDVTFICKKDGKTIHAHSVVMKNKSLLVESHLDLLKLQQKLFISLEDISSHTVLNLLQFLYSGEVTVSEKEAESLHQLCLLLKIDFGQEIISIPTKQNSGRSKLKANKNSGSSHLSSRGERGNLVKKELSSNPHSPDKNQLLENVSRKPQSNPKPVPMVKDTRLYCYCQKPTSKDLIGCDHCPQWYHPSCLDLSPASVDIILGLPSWRCPECQRAIERREKRHRQIQLPIPRGGKFCEIKTSRLESWGVADYERCGWAPVTPTHWKPLGTGSDETQKEKEEGSLNDRRRHRNSMVVEEETPPSPKKRKSCETDNLNNCAGNAEDNVVSDFLASSTPKMRAGQSDDNFNALDDLLDGDAGHYGEGGSFYDELFFCYICKSIFVSKQALEIHQFSHH